MRTWQHTTYTTAPLVLLALGALVQGTDASIFTTTIKVCLYDGAGCDNSPSGHYCSEIRNTMKDEDFSGSPLKDVDIGDCDQGCFDMDIDYGKADCDDMMTMNMTDGVACQVGQSPDNGAPIAMSFECSNNKSVVIGGIVGGSVAAMIGRSVLPSPLSWSARPQGRPPKGFPGGSP